MEREQRTENNDWRCQTGSQLLATAPPHNTYLVFFDPHFRTASDDEMFEQLKLIFNHVIVKNNIKTAVGCGRESLENGEQRWVHSCKANTTRRPNKGHAIITLLIQSTRVHVFLCLVLQKLQN